MKTERVNGMIDESGYQRAEIVQKVCEMVSSNGYERPDLIQVLQDISAEYNYLPREGLRCVSERLGVPFAEVYSAATFYKAFSLEPRGKYIVQVCTGTACHVKGSQRILDGLEQYLGIKSGETTPDLNFTLQAVNCLGCCGLAPVVTIGEEAYGKMNQTKIFRIIEKYKFKKGEVCQS